MASDRLLYKSEFIGLRKKRSPDFDQGIGPKTATALRFLMMLFGGPPHSRVCLHFLNIRPQLSTKSRCLSGDTPGVGCTPVISALPRWKQEVRGESKTSLHYIRPCLCKHQLKVMSITKYLRLLSSAMCFKSTT